MADFLVCMGASVWRAAVSLAMTGHQPNPGMAQTMLGENVLHLDIESIMRGLGVSECVKVRAFNLKTVLGALREMKYKSGVLPFGTDVLEIAVKKFLPSRMQEINLKALALGSVA